MKDKIVRQTLLGTTGVWDENFAKCRTTTFTFPSNGEEAERKITFMASDGLLFYLIRRLEKLENRLAVLECKKK